MKAVRWIGLVVVGIVVLIGLHGYFYTTGLLNKAISRCGAYPTLDEAIQADFLHNNFDPAWFEEYIKAQNSKRVSWTWYVVKKVKPEYAGELQQAPKPDYFCGGSFYHHTKAGWVGMPENYWNAFGLMDLWMWVYRLY